MTRRLLPAREGVAALEMALVLPLMLLFVFGLFAVYSLLSARRAMDYGIEKALRYAATNSSGGAAAVSTAFKTAASIVWSDVGANATVTVTPTPTFKASDTVQVAVTYAWSPLTSVIAANGASLFPAMTLSATASMRVVN